MSVLRLLAILAIFAIVLVCIGVTLAPFQEAILYYVRYEVAHVGNLSVKAWWPVAFIAIIFVVAWAYGTLTQDDYYP